MLVSIAQISAKLFQLLTTAVTSPIGCRMPKQRIKKLLSRETCGGGTNLTDIDDRRRGGGGCSGCCGADMFSSVDRRSPSVRIEKKLLLHTKKDTEYFNLYII